MSKDDEITALRNEVKLFRAVLENFVENPFIYRSPSFRPLIEAMGYEYTQATTRRPFRRPLEVTTIRKVREDTT